VKEDGEAGRKIFQRTATLEGKKGWSSALLGLGHGADLVPVLQVDQPDALGAAADRQDLLGLDADDFAAQRCNEEVVLGDAQHGHGRPDLGRDSEVDVTLAAAVLLPVEGDLGPLAVAFLARREDVFLLVADGHHADENLHAIKIFDAITVQTGWQSGS
jgi:hypothetical protein